MSEEEWSGHPQRQKHTEYCLDLSFSNMKVILASKHLKSTALFWRQNIYFWDGDEMNGNILTGEKQWNLIDPLLVTHCYFSKLSPLLISSQDYYFNTLSQSDNDPDVDNTQLLFIYGVELDGMHLQPCLLEIILILCFAFW